MTKSMRISALISSQQQQQNIMNVFFHLFPSTSLLGMFQVLCSVCTGKGRVVAMDLCSLPDCGGTLEGKLSCSSMRYQVWWCLASWHLSFKADTFSKNAALLLWRWELPLPSVFKNCLPLGWLLRRGCRAWQALLRSFLRRFLTS